MQKKENVVAYIDGANLHKGIESQGWVLDYRRFRVWLREKHGVQDAYIFLGLIPKFSDLYRRLQEVGYILVFKEVVYDSAGKAKGNCDADLVLHVVRGFFEQRFEKAVLVTSDGDYAGLVRFLLEVSALQMIVSPSREDRCSILLKKINAPITYLGSERLRPHLQRK